MAKLSPKVTKTVFVMVLLLFWLGQAVSVLAAEQERWELTISGDTNAKCEMVLIQSKTGQGIYIVTGNFRGEVFDKRWGAGYVRCKLKGKTGKSAFKATITGYADMKEGEAIGTYALQGRAEGTLSSSTGSGTWAVDHQYGAHSGNWSAKQIE